MTPLVNDTNAEDPDFFGAQLANDKRLTQVSFADAAMNAVKFKARLNSSLISRSPFQTHSDSFGRAAEAAKEFSPMLLLALMCCFFTAYGGQFYISVMYIHHLPGNKFINGMLFGCAESISVVFWGYLMARMSDMTVFNIIVASALTSYSIYIFLHEHTMLCYMGMILLVAALGGW